MADARTLIGKPVAREINDYTAERVESFKSKTGRDPRLGVLTVDDPAGLSYLKSIRSTGKKLGVEVVEFPVDSLATTGTVTNSINSLNEDDTIDGVLIQTPVPEGVNYSKAAAALDPQKDVDGITPTQAGYLFQGDKQAVPPSTARAAMEILDYNKYGLQGLEVVIIGRSLVVGKPFGLLALARNATVTWTHSKTHSLHAVCKRAEVLIVAAGRPRMVNETFVRPGATVIDVGINVDENGKLCGDVDSERITSIAAAYTPVPGGVGPVTTACLFANLMDAANRKLKG